MAGFSPCIQLLVSFPALLLQLVECFIVLSCFNCLLRQVEGGWIIEGQKRWIGNSTFADLLIIFARNTTTNQINGYVRFLGFVDLLDFVS